MSTSTPATAAILRAAGFAICRPDPKEKKPTYKSWPTRSLEPSDFVDGDQIGILAGPLSDAGAPGHALVVIDLDAPEAVTRADEHFPGTPMMDGRAGKPKSHRYYLVPFDSVPSWAASHADQASKAAKEQKGHAGPFTKSFRDRETDKEVIRFLGTGGQCVCPPSVHDSGEVREWSGGNRGEVSSVPFERLWQAVCELASACGAKIPDVGNRPPRGRGDHVPTAVVDRAVKYLATCPPSISAQGGHHKQMWAARVLVYGFDLGTEQSIHLLATDFNPRCQPPWSESEIQHKVEDADRIPFTQPRGWLRDAENPRTSDPKATFPGAGSGPRRESVKSGSNSGDSGAAFRSAASPPAPLPTMPDVPPFPLHLFPPAIADYWSAAARSLNVPVDYVAVPALPLLGAAIGRSRAASVKRTYSEPPLFWCALVAPPGRAKSPSLGAAKGPLSAHTKRQGYRTTKSLSCLKLRRATLHFHAMRRCNPLFQADFVVR